MRFRAPAASETPAVENTWPPCAPDRPPEYSIVNLQRLRRRDGILACPVRALLSAPWLIVAMLVFRLAWWRFCSPMWREVPLCGLRMPTRCRRRCGCTTMSCAPGSRVAAAMCSRRPATRSARRFSAHPTRWPRPSRSRRRSSRRRGRARRFASGSVCTSVKQRSAAGDYFGPTVNTAARVEAVGHGGQILITEPVRVAADAAGLTDLGAYSLKGVPEPVKLFQVGDGKFPPLRTTGAGGSNLPTPATRLVGREADVRDARLLLAQHRLVTERERAGGSEHCHPREARPRRTGAPS